MGACCALTVFTLRYFPSGRKYDLSALCNGILGGLVSITAGCSNVESGSAVLIGIVGGFIYCASSALMQKLKVDDPVDAFSVHGACGIWGCIAAALFDFGAGMDKHHGWSTWSAGTWGDEEHENRRCPCSESLRGSLRHRLEWRIVSTCVLHSQEDRDPPPGRRDGVDGHRY